MDTYTRRKLQIAMQLLLLVGDSTTIAPPTDLGTQKVNPSTMAPPNGKEEILSRKELMNEDITIMSNFSQLLAVKSYEMTWNEDDFTKFKTFTEWINNNYPLNSSFWVEGYLISVKTYHNDWLPELNEKMEQKDAWHLDGMSTFSNWFNRRNNMMNVEEEDPEIWKRMREHNQLLLDVISEATDQNSEDQTRMENFIQQLEIILSERKMSGYEVIDMYDFVVWLSNTTIIMQWKPEENAKMEEFKNWLTENADALEEIREILTPSTIAPSPNDLGTQEVISSTTATPNVKEEILPMNGELMNEDIIIVRNFSQLLADKAFEMTWNDDDVTKLQTFTKWITNTPIDSSVLGMYASIVIKSFHNMWSLRINTTGDQHVSIPIEQLTSFSDWFTRKTTSMSGEVTNQTIIIQEHNQWLLAITSDVIEQPRMKDFSQQLEIISSERKMSLDEFEDMQDFVAWISNTKITMKWKPEENAKMEEFNDWLEDIQEIIAASSITPTPNDSPGLSQYWQPFLCIFLTLLGILETIKFEF